MIRKKNRGEINDVKTAGLGYTIGNIILKGIVFLSLPIFTKLMKPSEFGIYNNYIAYETIFSAILGLGFYSTIKKAYLEYSVDFGKYYSSITFVNLLFFVFLLLICFVCKKWLKILTGFDDYIILLLLCQSFGSALLQIYSSYLNVKFKYKSYLGLSFFNSFLNIFISVVLIIFVFPENSYIGRIIGTSVPYIIIALYIILIVLFKGNFAFQKKFILFGVKMGLPLVPHVIAQFVLNQSDRILITKYIGEDASGLYSYAYSICTILLVVLQSFDSTWTPWTYLKYEEKKDNYVHEASKKMLLFSLAIYVGFICLAPDVYKIMGDQSYLGGVPMIIPLALSMFFLYLYFIPVNLEYYNKQTIFVSIGTILAATINIVLNIIFIPICGYIVAAFTTLISYLFLFLIHIIISRKHNLKSRYNCKILTIVVLISIIVSFFLELSALNTYFDYFIRYLLLIIDIFFILLYFKNEIKSFLKFKN